MPRRPFSRLWDHVTKLPQNQIETTPHPASAILTAMFGIVSEQNNDQVQANLNAGQPPKTSPASTTVASTSKCTSATGLPFHTCCEYIWQKCHDNKDESFYLSQADKVFTREAARSNSKIIPLHCQILTSVDDPYFRALLRECNQVYQFPGRDEVSERIIPQMYEVALLKLKDELKNVEYAALTGDGWTSRAADHYMTLTVHYLKDWTMQVRVLQTLKAKVSQTGNNIAAEIKECLTEFSLEAKVDVMTTDNARAMVNATKAAGIKLSLNCFAHTLNLSTQKVMHVPTVSSMLAIMRPPITYFRNSYLAKVVLKEKQVALGKPNHTLILDCKTRWNSSYLMVERFVEQYPAVVAASLKERIKKKDSFKRQQKCSDKDVEKMECFLDLMKLPYIITVTMSSEKRPTSGQVLPMLHKLEQHLADKEEDDKFTKDIKSSIREDLSARYREAERREFLEEATALDPRFKGSAVVPMDVWDRLTNRIEVSESHMSTVLKNTEPDKAVPVPVPHENSDDDTTPVKKPRLSAMEEIFEDEDDDVVAYVETALPLRLRIQQEMLLFRALPKMKSSDDVLAFWQGKVDELPLLSRHAKKYLIVPGTSVPSERIFSTAGDIVSAERARLDPDSVNMLLFLNKNT
ncbi:E3 SUMO-protein ligase ZBED1-like [Eucyclogobius newberryi]|uniref:E3 SUMO-protein ligase ZBED1-like n=1 Tax=Eucyclogobius newberryi TaxID=166745 RepID=UPI003B5AB100